ncbi:MAG: cysteine desulfurase family protein [Christensenellales bacterium]
MENRKVYLDNASTTYVGNEALREMMPVFSNIYGNPSSLHSFGRDAVNLLDQARDRVAKAIGAKSSEIYFTSGGTEANNLAIKGLAYANRYKGNHIITSCIEHSSVLEACRQLEKEGFQVTYLKVDANGLINFADLLHYINSQTILISIMTANNEIGTIQHMQAIAETAKEKGIIFHTDAVQAVGAISFNVDAMGIDAMSISSHKIYGPKGVGCLFVRDGVKIQSIISGGKQERGVRGGTQNVPAIVGFGKAIEVAVRDMSINNKKIKSLKEYFIKRLTESVSDIYINGHPAQRLQSIVSVSFDCVNAEAVLTMLDMQGIAVSVGSACESGNLEPSHVLKAIGLDDVLAKGTIRFSFGKSNTKEDIDYLMEKLVPIIEKLRSISPLRKKKRKED